MYANLKVKLRHDRRDEVLYAYDVHVLGPIATVFLDGSDGSSRAEPAGERVVDLRTHAMTITASF